MVSKTPSWGTKAGSPGHFCSQAVHLGLMSTGMSIPHGHNGWNAHSLPMRTGFILNHVHSSTCLLHKLLSLGLVGREGRTRQIVKAGICKATQ